MRSVFIFLIVSTAAAMPGPVRGAGGDPASHLLFQLDNDLFTGSDRDYTNGARMAWLQPIEAGTMNRFQGWLRDLSGAGDAPFFSRLANFVRPEDIRYDWGVGLTQLMYTPQDPQLPASPPGERPYAGWLGAEFSLHAKDTRAVSSVTFSIGVTGTPALARQTQEWVHRNISNSPIFQGWSSQVPTEVTVNLNFDRKQRFTRLAEATADWLIAADGYFEWGAGVGNFRTDAYAGAVLRAGYNLPLQYLMPRIQLGTYAHELFSGERRNVSNWSLFAFAGARGSAVAHDITLDGPLFSDYAGAVDSEPLVGEIVAGAGLRYRRFTVTFSRTFRSEEFDGQQGGHQFGSVLASVGF